MRRLAATPREGALVLVTRRVDRDPAVALLVAAVRRAFSGPRRIVNAKLAADAE